MRAMFIAIEVAGLLFIVAGVYAYSEALAYIVFGEMTESCLIMLKLKPF